MMETLIKALVLVAVVAFLGYLVISAILIILPLLAMIIGFGAVLGLLVFLAGLWGKKIFNKTF